MWLESFMINYGYITLFVLLAWIGFGGIVPPGSKFPYIFAGFYISTGVLKWEWTLLAGALGHTVGNYIQYLVAKKHGIKVFRKWRTIPQKKH